VGIAGEPRSVEMDVADELRSVKMGIASEMRPTEIVTVETREYCD
jgi:hypothetical protein